MAGVLTYPPLILASEAGYLEVVDLLLVNNAEVDIEGSGQYTSLMISATIGRTAVVEMLLDAGANVNAKSAEGTKNCVWHVLIAKSVQLPMIWVCLT